MTLPLILPHLTDTELESQSVVQTVLSTARDPNRVLAFNMASQALNNSFFLDNLVGGRTQIQQSANPHLHTFCFQAPLEASTENHEDKLPAPLQHAIKTEFGSLAQLKSNLSAAALGMMTSGWIWLVMDTGRRLAIVPTYGSGTVLVRSRQQMVPRHLAPSVERLPNSRPGSLESTSGPSGSSRLTSSSTTSSSTPPNPTSATHPFDRQGQTRKLGSNQNDTDKPAADSLFDASGNVGPGSSSASNALANSGYSLHPTTTGPLHHYGDKLSPLFCVSVHEHAWLHDYGVWGKEEYLTRFWNALDWGRVARLYYELGRSM